MGIRFHCRHCEKRLNVKGSQAGKAGQCPHCRGRIVVPNQSTIASELEKQMHVRRGKESNSQDLDDSSIGLYDVDAQVTMEGLPAEQRHQRENIQLNSPAPPPMVDESDEDSSELFMLDKPQLPASMGKVDPIAEAPNRVWYFRSRKLGEKGPLKGKIMQKHLDEGDVVVGSIVWREDWNDWLPAERVFPSLVAEVTKRRQSAKENRAFKDANYTQPKPADAKTVRANRARRKNQIFAGAIILGCVVIIVLLFVLLKLVADNP